MNLLDMVMSRSDRLVAPLAGYPGVRLAGRSVREALHDATVQLEALKSLEERLRPDIVFPLLDLTVEAESMGLGVNFHDKLPPSLAQQKLPMLDRFYALGLPDPEKAGRMPVFLEVAEGLSARGGRMSGAYVTGPLTLLAQLLGTGELLDRVKLGHPQRAPCLHHLHRGEYAAALAARRTSSWWGSAPRPGGRGLSRLPPDAAALVGIIRSSGAIAAARLRRRLPPSR